MLICPACQQPCTGVWHDYGRGAYEFWGRPGIDVDVRYVSNCCEVELPCLR